LVVDGPGWVFVRRFDKAKDGRSAVLALQGQAEGVSAKLTRKAKQVYASITSVTFRGQCRGFTFANYVTVHQEAHNELFDLEEPMSESKKVTDFLKGSRSPSWKDGHSVRFQLRWETLKNANVSQHAGSKMAVQAKAKHNVSSIRTKG
jgi:hypothetical protein